jgi:hypothetical protein
MGDQLDPFPDRPVIALTARRSTRHTSSAAKQASATTASTTAAGTRQISDHRGNGRETIHHMGGSMTGPPSVPDTLVIFTDAVNAEFRVMLPRDGHTDADVRTVAYRWACKQVADGVMKPYRELVYRSIGSTL